MTSPTPRCTTRGCPVTYRSGDDRACGMHSDGDDSLAARMAAFESLSAAPGQHGETDSGDSADDAGEADGSGRQ